MPSNIRKMLIAAAMVSASPSAFADVITDWNQGAMDVMKAVSVAGNPWTRTLAIMHVAMSDAVNAVHNRYTRFIPDIPATQNASAEGKTVFNSNCKSCHTLKDAGATGSVGPNLDDLQPDKATVSRQVENGGGPMPAFKGKLSDIAWID